MKDLFKPRIQAQIKSVDHAIAENPEYENILNLHREILKIREPIERSLTKGARINWDRELPLKLRQNLHSKKEAAVKNLSSSIFDEAIAADVCRKVIHTLSRHKVGGKNLLKISNALKSGEIVVKDSIEAAINDSAEWFEEQGERFEVDVKLLSYIFSIPIQSCLEEIARKMDPSFLEKWWQPSCPVCGRIPQIAWLKDGKRYLTCSFCGTQYLADMFLCVNCWNRDPYTLGYLKPKDQPGLRVDFCEKCKHYVKTIDEEKLGGKIPRGLEDIFTRNLDKLIRRAFI